MRTSRPAGSPGPSRPIVLPMTTPDSLARSRTATRLLGVASSVPFLRVFAPRAPIVCLYHSVPSGAATGGIDSRAFERHVRFLKQHCEFVSPDNEERRRGRRDKCQILLTFDDGFRNNAEVVAPILRRYGIPAIFFVSSRHALPGKYLWFSYLLALERHFKGTGFLLRGEFISMAADQRKRSVDRLRRELLAMTPHPASMYDVIENELPRLEDFVDRPELVNWYAGMTGDQIGELASDRLFTLGGHTIDHPFLTRCSHEEARRQVNENRIWLEEVTQRPCSTIAYPSGDYNGDVLGACRDMGFVRGYATTPIDGRDKQFEVSRMGIYSPSVDVLGFKVHWGHALRAMGMKVG
jgi:peptidoglycan/xylan/chitin deacetylase (PgdA/CDA1 family)